MSATAPREVLGVAKTATQREARTAFRAIMKVVHPDRWHNSDQTGILHDISQKVTGAMAKLEEEARDVCSSGMLAWGSCAPPPPPPHPFPTSTWVPPPPSGPPPSSSHTNGGVRHELRTRGEVLRSMWETDSDRVEEAQRQRGGTDCQKSHNGRTGTYAGWTMCMPEAEPVGGKGDAAARDVLF